jgi:hypothetical protein
MKKVWNWFINLSLLVGGIKLLVIGINSIIHFNTNFSYSSNLFLENKSSYNIGYEVGYIVGAFLTIPIAIALFYLFYERVSLSKSYVK